MKKRAKIKLAVILLVVVVLMILIGRYPDPDTDAEYLVWKAGLTPGNYHVCFRYFEEDDDFRRSLVGKSREELSRWFPVLVSSRAIKSHPSDAY